MLFSVSRLDFYNSQNSNLAQWLWSTLIQADLDKLRHHFNNHVTRKDHGKQLPSGCSPHVAMALYSQYGGENCLQPVDTKIIDALIAEIGGDEILEFVTPAFAKQAQGIYDVLQVGELTFQNVWLVFSKMLPLM
jgi:hypothetical protein